MLYLFFIAVLLVVALPASAGSSLGVKTTSPGNGQTVSGSVTWEVTVSSGNVDHVDFAVDGVVKWTESVGPWQYNGVAGGLNTTQLSDGTHQLTAKAYSKNGKTTGSSMVSVNVANAAAPAPPPPPPPPPPPNPTPPTSATLPSISGTPTVGQTLSASSGTWSGSTPMTYSYGWVRCASSGGSCGPISGATSLTYAAASADTGSTLRVTVTATNSAGSATATSAATAVVTTAPSAPSTGLGAGLPPRMPESTGSKSLYLATTGSDSNSGTLTSPLKTLNKALSIAGDGTNIYVRGGSYGAQPVAGRRFSPSNPVTVQGYPGETATFVGQTTYTNAITLTDCQGIRLRDITIDAPYNANLKVDTSQHIDFDNLIVRNAGRSGTGGVDCSSSAILVTRSPTTTTSRCGTARSTTTASRRHGYDHQIYLGSAGDLKGTSDEAGLRGGVFANNLVYDGPTGYGLQLGDSARNVIITNNTFVHQYDPVSSAGSAIMVWNGQTNTWGTRDCLIVNNIFTNNVASAVISSLSQNATSNVVRNNLAFANGQTSYVPTYGTKVGFTLGTNFASADPLYVNYANKNFHLQAGSPALGKADPAYAPPRDGDGNARALYVDGGSGLSAPALGAFG